MSEEENIPQQNSNEENVNENILPAGEEDSQQQIIEQLSTENMEVHKHPHHVTHKKKWGEYLLEFFMLFLAVFLGFVAENIRENSLERNQEKEYMQLMVEDLQKDTSNINTFVAGNRVLISGLDTLLDLLSEPKQDTNYQRKIYIYSLKNAYWYMPIQFSETTLTQLKSSGGFRLITDRKIITSILQYDQGLDACKYNFDLLLNYYHVFEATNKELFNMTLARKSFKAIEKDFTTVFLSYDDFVKLVPAGKYLDKNDPSLILKYHDDVLYYQTTLSNLTNIVAVQKLQSDSLMKLIKDHYNLKSEK